MQPIHHNKMMIAECSSMSLCSMVSAIDFAYKVKINITLFGHFYCIGILYGIKMHASAFIDFSLK
jgi:hypothetical protein